MRQRFEDARRRIGTLAVAAQHQADRRAAIAALLRRTGQHGVIVTADALETDAKLLRELAVEGADYHALLGELSRVRRELVDTAVILDVLHAAGEPGPVL